MSKIIQFTVGLVVVVAIVLAFFGLFLLVAQFVPWIILGIPLGAIFFMYREDVCLLGETILTLAKAIWSKP